MQNNKKQSKPKRLAKLEQHYANSSHVVKFDDGFGGEWMVYISGHFADFQIREIANALRTANKAGKL